MILKWVIAALFLSNALSLNISCCDVWNEYLEKIRLSNDDNFIECTPETCMNAQHIKHFLRESRTLVGTEVLTEELTWDNASLSSPTLAEVLVLAYVGRHFTVSNSYETQQHPFFRFHGALESLTLIRPQCSFERTVYLCMIVVTVVVLIGTIILQTMREKTKQVAETCEMPQHEGMPIGPIELRVPDSLRRRN